MKSSVIFTSLELSLLSYFGGFAHDMSGRKYRFSYSFFILDSVTFLC